MTDIEISPLRGLLVKSCLIIGAGNLLNGGIKMSTLTIDEQHEGRNAIVKISGHIKKLKKECNIPDQDYVLIFARLKIIDDIFKDCNK